MGIQCDAHPMTSCIPLPAANQSAAYFACLRALSCTGKRVIQPQQTLVVWIEYQVPLMTVLETSPTETAKIRMGW